MTRVGCALKSRTLMSRFISPYQIMKRVEEVAYRVALLLFLSNLDNIFHVSQLRNYIPEPSHVIEMDNVQVKENLVVEASPLRVEDNEVKHLRGKDIALVKVVQGGPAGGNMTWELESQMRVGMAI